MEPGQCSESGDSQGNSQSTSTTALNMKLVKVVFVTLTTFTSFMFSAVVLVDWLLPWESPLSLR